MKVYPVRKVSPRIGNTYSVGQSTFRQVRGTWCCLPDLLLTSAYLVAVAAIGSQLLGLPGLQSLTGAVGALSLD